MKKPTQENKETKECNCQYEEDHSPECPLYQETEEYGHTCSSPSKIKEEGWVKQLEDLAHTEPDPNSAVYNLPQLKGFISNLLASHREEDIKKIEKIFNIHEEDGGKVLEFFDDNTIQVRLDDILSILKEKE